MTVWSNEMKSAAIQDAQRVNDLYEALKRLEDANEAVASDISQEAYSQMMRDGLGDALIELDAARLHARKLMRQCEPQSS